MTEPKKEKCEACCGSGYINFWTDDGHISMRTCRRCDGYGYIKVKQMTNEEWLRTATFEEMAGTIYEWHTKGYARGRLEVDLNPITEVVEWLKQPHNTKE